MKKNNKNYIEFEITNQNPIDNPITYDIKTIKDIGECVTIENADGFLKDFELALRSFVLAKAMTTPDENNKNITFEGFEWIDDWERK